MAYSDLILAESSLIGYWKLNETSGTIVDVKNAYNGTATNSPTYNTAKISSGLDGGSMTFIKASSTYITLGDVNGLEAHANHSFEFWFVLDSLPTAGEVLNAFVGKNNQYYITYYNNGTDYRFHTSSRYGDAPAQSVITLVVGTVYHFVQTWDGTNVKHYLNDSLIGTNTQSSAQNAGVTEAVEFARFGTSYYLGGRMQHIAFYNDDLTATQVSNHYREGRRLTAKIVNGNPRNANRRASLY